MLTVFGSINIDQVIRVAQIARPGETVSGRLEAVTFGGKGANQAVAAARLLAGSHRVAMAGALGHDGHADRLLQNFAANSVVTDLIVRVPGPSGTAIITVDDVGENAITLIGGANDAVMGTQLGTAEIAQTEILLCQGEVSFAETAAAIASYRAGHQSGRIVLNLAPVPAAEAAMLQQALSATDFLIVNELELADLGAALGGKTEPEAIAARFALTLVVTLGSQGAVAVTPDGVRHVAGSPRVAVVDTTGAGDTFVGVLAALLAEGSGVPDALAQACVAGALSCTRLGAQGGMPSRAELAAGALA
ncbi:ribokinase [Devosia neptuniae]|jgi:ribokinase|uniref:ribokinase n=1 Tax=Devosia TaxID=46913 RepID=UPI0022AEB0EB|nr:ribokinase [Devosia neptuniae]MCZ4348138.1 ribokinase [Devosia neptuniae]|tara:strand:+ start:5368 stop:6282 length:915 start_codon:yes stop_codon:yes gene_type:complete